MISVSEKWMKNSIVKLIDNLLNKMSKVGYFFKGDRNRTVQTQSRRDYKSADFFLCASNYAFLCIERNFFGK